jgi:hypothetical protein
MIFADKSKNSLDVYFQDGFTDLYSEMNTFIDDMNTKYGWSIAHVSPPSNK